LSCFVAAKLTHKIDSRVCASFAKNVWNVRQSRNLCQFQQQQNDHNHNKYHADENMKFVAK